MTDAAEPTIELDEYTRDYLLLQATKKELDRLKAEYEHLRAEFVKRIGQNHVATIAGREVFTNKPTATFRPNLWSAGTSPSQESNLEPAALETAALPIELLAYLKSQIWNLGFQIPDHFRFTLCIVCLRRRGEYFLTSTFCAPPATLISVR